MNVKTGTGENVKIIFQNALHNYNKVIKELKNEEELDFSDARIQEDIQDNLEKNIQMIKKLGSNDGLATVHQNDKFLCDCLRGYISHLEKAKSAIATKLQQNSLPVIDLTKVDDELELSNRILKNLCEDHDS